MVILKRANVIPGGYITYERLFCHRLDISTQPAEMISFFSQFIKRFIKWTKCKILNITKKREKDFSFQYSIRVNRVLPCTCTWLHKIDYINDHIVNSGNQTETQLSSRRTSNSAHSSSNLSLSIRSIKSPIG